MALIHTYGEKNTVYVRCDIRDSRKQFTDPVPEYYPVPVPPRQKPIAAVALGNIEVPVLPLKHDELEEMCRLAASKFRKAGYESECSSPTTNPSVSAFFRNPRVQAFMMIGHAGDGEMECSNGSVFSYADVPLVTASKWLCDPTHPLHPTIRELALLGCESHHPKWPDLFFRLERYHAYRDKVWSASFSSRIMDYVKSFRPTPPRIAPPER